MLLRTVHQKPVTSFVEHLHVGYGYPALLVLRHTVDLLLWFVEQVWDRDVRVFCERVRCRGGCADGMGDRRMYAACSISRHVEK